MTRGRRVVSVTLAVAGALAILAVCFVLFVLYTTPGGKLALNIANGRDLPARAETFEGRIASRFRLTGVRLDSGSVEAEIDTVIVAWRPGALRQHRVDVVSLEIAGADVRIRESAADTAAVPMSAGGGDSSVGKWVIEAGSVRLRRGSLAAPGDVNLTLVEASGNGGPEGYRADVTASGSAGRIAGVHVEARVSGNSEAATLDTLDVHVLGGRVWGGGFVRWTPALSWKARLNADTLRVGEIAPAPDDWLGSVSFRATTTGDLLGDSTRINVDLDSLEGTLRDRPLAAAGNVRLRGRFIEASDANVRWGNARATFQGSVGDVVDVTLDASIPALGEVVPHARGSVRVRGRVSGMPATQDVSITFTGDTVEVAGRNIPDIRAIVEARLESENYVPHSVEAKHVDIRLAGGTLGLQGHAAWGDDIRWDVSIAANDFETSTLAPARWDLRGPVSVRAHSSGRRTARGLQGRLVLESLRGTFRGHPLNGSGSAEIRGREADFTGFRVDWGDIHVDANGHYGEDVDLTLHVNAPDLKLVHRDLSGVVVVDGRVLGPRTKPSIDATFSADSLRVRKYSAARVDGDVYFDPAFEKPANATIRALGIAAGGEPLDSVSVELSGPREDHRFVARVVRGDLRAAVVFRGALADTVWTGHVETLELVQHMLGAWHASSNAALRATPSAATLDSLILASGTSRFSVQGTWARGDTIRVDAGLDDFPLANLGHHLARGAAITGTLDGTAQVLVDPAGGIGGSLNLVPGPGRLTAAGKSIDYDGSIKAVADQTGVTAAADMMLKRDGQAIATLDGDFRVPGFVPGRDSLGTQPLDAQVKLDCSDIAPLLQLALPDFVSNAAGRLTVLLEPRGTVGSFRLAGTMNLSDARFDLASGLRLRDVALSLESEGDGRASVNGHATSGGGRVNLTASSQRAGDARVAGIFRVKGERFQIVNQPEAQIFVSPDVEARLADRDLNITGDVRVPFARIETTEVPANAVSESNDVVFVEDTLSTRAPMRVKTRLRVALGDSVTFSGFGLRARRLEGSLSVEDETGQPTRGTGEVAIKDGKYRAYGNDLTIDPGRFMFGGGPIDNPGVDVRAYRGLTTQNVMAGSTEMVGVYLRGTLRKIEFSVFSNPPMSESEVLSYLMFGRPLSTGSSSEQAALANAAMILGMQQGQQLAGSVGKQFALDDAYIETGETLKEASFVAGKYLSPKLYVSYAAGFFEQTNTFRVRYSLSTHWTLQAENGRYNSSDILYWFEHGK